MNPPSRYSEASLVERPAIELFEELGYESANCFYEKVEENGSTLGRKTTSEVVLTTRLYSALKNLNPELPEEAFGIAIEKLTRDRSAMSLAQANREVYKLIKDGVKVKIRDPEGDGEISETVKVIDWNEPENNDYFLASQFWVSGEMYKRRADLMGFVNGLPLIFIELKATHRRLENAYKGNLSNYKDTIPQIFWYNAFVILSNGSESKIGSVTAEWGHFAEWKKITSEGEEGVVSLETMIRGTCEKKRLLDIVENFTLFMDAQGGLIKLIAKNHQYFGVNNTTESLLDIESQRGKLGVFWHTQGSGKSISMIFFSQKVLRKIPGNWTFVIVTDRRELDKQIYKNFVSTGVITEKQAQATSSTHLRSLLTEDHRYVFTLIHKFRTNNGERHPVLSDRSDIIVITDEAHRTQYDTLALNMRTALPNASFIAFTGTPLIIEEERTRDVFGDYVTIYNFKQSVDDGATVPLYYENRIPELQLTNEDLNKEMEGLLENAELDEREEQKLEREFSNQYNIITRNERLERVAEDIVNHFMGRGYQHKAMVVCIDKATAVGMYDKIKRHWENYLERLKTKEKSATSAKRDEIREKIRFMKETDMAVVVSQSQNEGQEMRSKGLDITPHRRRMVEEDLDTKFKDPEDPFRIVFVCAMWMTGFDVPSCSTIYLDKPMRNHTLMQTIARANRVFPEKVNGTIVDYVGVFRNLERALAIYGSGSGGGVEEGEMPVMKKSELVRLLRESIEEASSYCGELGIDLEKILASEGFEKIRLLDDARDAILVNDETKRKFLSLADRTGKLFKAILPDPEANDFAPKCILFRFIVQKIRMLTPQVDVSDVMGKVEDILDRSVAAEGYELHESRSIYDAAHLVDLSKIDFEALKAEFEKGRKRTEVAKLKGFIGRKLMAMISLNRSRMDYMARFRSMIDEYNAGSINAEVFFKELMEFLKTLSEEEKRGIKEKLTEEELAIFDLLTKPEMKLTKNEEKQVKKLAQELLKTLKWAKLVIDWRKKQQSRAGVRLAIETTLDKLPDRYSNEVYEQKCDLVYQHIYDSYYGPSQSVYAYVAEE
ncbi:MAG: type I restriction endonuclease subunit R [Candidatus Hydrothermarchaeales archaeon]